MKCPECRKEMKSTTHTIKRRGKKVFVVVWRCEPCKRTMTNPHEQEVME